MPQHGHSNSKLKFCIAAQQKNIAVKLPSSQYLLSILPGNDILISVLILYRYVWSFKKSNNK